MPTLNLTYDEDEVRALIAADVERRFGRNAEPQDVKRDQTYGEVWSISLDCSPEEPEIANKLPEKPKEKPKLGAKLLAARRRVFGNHPSAMAYDAASGSRPHAFYLSDLLNSQQSKDAK